VKAGRSIIRRRDSPRWKSRLQREATARATTFRSTEERAGAVLFHRRERGLHKVSDDGEDQRRGTGFRGRAVFTHLAELVFTDVAVPFTVPPPTPPALGGEGYGRGSGVRFGIVPDFGGEPGKGAKITGTSEGSPAEKAGLMAGDVIIRFGGKAVTGLEDLSYALRDKKPGDEVEVVVVREARKSSSRPSWTGGGEVGLPVGGADRGATACDSAYPRRGPLRYCTKML